MKMLVAIAVLIASPIAADAQTPFVNPYKDETLGVTGYRSEVLSEVIVQENKSVRLAEAIPAEKYTWRPAPDVRSIAEVFCTSAERTIICTRWSARRLRRGST